MNARVIRSAVITGASGMIGAALSQRLLREGVTVYAVVRPGSRKVRNLDTKNPNLRLLYCDLREIQKLPPVQADAFFHFAWDGTYGEARNDEARQEANVSYSLDALRKASECGVKVFLGAGSQAEYGPLSGKVSEDLPMHPETAYGKAKLHAEEALRGEARVLGIDFIWARILSVYGPFDNSYTMVMQAASAFLRGEHPSFTKGEQHWDYLYQDDAAEAFYRMAVLSRSGEAYVLGSGEDRLLRDYILDIRDAVDPLLPAGLGEIPYREHQTMYLSADIRKLREDTGFMPSVSFRDGIRETVRSLKGTGL